jgi:hypothetical protein
VAVVMELATLPERERRSSRRTAIRYAADDPSSRRAEDAVSGTASVAARLFGVGKGGKKGLNEKIEKETVMVDGDGL